MKSEYKVLMVDDEPNILSGYKRSLGRQYNLFTAEGGHAGLEVIKEHGPFPVIITDMRMPSMDGLAFLQEAQRDNKRCVYMMLTGNADQQTAIKAINEGHIFRFLNKPCPGEQLDLAIQSCIKQYELIEAEHLLLRDTVAGSIKLLTQTISLSNPQLAKVNEAIRTDTLRIAKELGLPSDWRLSIAASLCLIGTAVAGTDTNLGTLSDETLQRHAQIGSNLIQHIPKLSEVAQIIERQRDTGPMPDMMDIFEILGEADASAHVIICARILRIAVDFRRALALTGMNKSLAFERMIADNPLYDDRLLDAFKKTVNTIDPSNGQGIEFVVQKVPIPKLTPGMSVTEDVISREGAVLLVKGSTLTSVVIERLKEYQLTKLYSGEISVYVPQTLAGQEAA